MFQVCGLNFLGTGQKTIFFICDLVPVLVWTGTCPTSGGGISGEGEGAGGSACRLVSKIGPPEGPLPAGRFSRSLLVFVLAVLGPVLVVGVGRRWAKL